MGVIREHTHQTYPKLYKCKVYLHGCDDTTEFEMEITEDEMRLLKEVEILSKATSTYECMPIMEIKKIK